MSESLYRFYAYNENDLHSVAGCYLWFSKLKDFNDPFEGLFYEQFNLEDLKNISKNDFLIYGNKVLKSEGRTSQEIEDFFIKMQIKGLFDKFKTNLIQEQISLLDKLTDEVINMRLHCSFCRDSTNNKVLQNKLMWSHYSNGLRGFTIEFCREKVEQGIEKMLKREITYSEIFYKKAIKTNIYDLLLDHLITPGSNSGVDKVFSRKDRHWEYENEFRYSDTPKEENSNKYYFPSNAIKSITLGEKMEVTKRVTLLAVLKSIGINIQKQVHVAKINPKTFELEVVNYYKYLSVPAEISSDS